MRINTNGKGTIAMKINFLLSIIVVVTAASIAAGYTNEEALENIRKRSMLKYHPFSVTLTSKISMGETKQDDSGTVFYSPTGCSKVEMYKTKTQYATCNDTTWYQMPNGDITRSVNKNDALNFMKNQATMPDFGAMIKKHAGKIVENLGDTALSFEVMVPVDEKNMQKMRLTFDTKQWLLRKVTVWGDQMGETVASYVYTQFQNKPMPKEVRIVMGNMGFMILSYTEYKEIKDKSKAYYRLY
jgi:outer membrane lipoprotein-sorting protein